MIQPETANSPETLIGVVLSGAHGIYEVHTDKGILRCTLRGKLKKAFAKSRSESASRTRAQRKELENPYSTTRNRSNPHPSHSTNNSEQSAAPVKLSIGDYVRISVIDPKSGAIEEILPRQSSFSRKDAGSTAGKETEQTLLANLDQVILVFATAQPEPHFGLLDRYLMICESAELKALVCLNKTDLPHRQEVDQDIDLYKQIGYPVLRTSIQTGEGVEEIRERLNKHTSLFTGPSGVGKSSLVNAIEPGMAVRTGLVSDTTGKGKHTTTGSQLYPLSGGGWLADSAGIRALAAWNIPQEEMAACFLEFRPYLGQCGYSDCLHVDEDGCAIKVAVEEGVISERRYISYARIVMGEER